MSTLDLAPDTQAGKLQAGAVVEVVVRRKRVLAEGVVGLTLESPDDTALARWEPGAHIDLILPGGTIRQYSLFGSLENPRRYEIGILIEPTGVASTFVRDEVEVGSRLHISTPRNHFRIVDAGHYLFIAGGVGVTPILPMIDYAEKHHRAWKLYYAGRSRKSMAFADDLAALGEGVVLAPKDAGARLDLAQVLGTAQPDTVVFCCGPDRMNDAVLDIGMKAWPKGAVHVERFVPVAVDNSGNRPFTVKLAKSNLTLEVPADRSAIDVMADAGVYIPCSCKEGTCGSCEVDVLEGIPDHRDSVLTPEERAENLSMMVCVSRAKTPILVLDA